MRGEEWRGQGRYQDSVLVDESTGKETREYRVTLGRTVLWESRMDDQSGGLGGGMGSQLANASPGDRERK